ncbi:MAG TPA: glycine zipper 2TM domain-containing protein [Gammaproteobacteria bacterium]|nr:glycine zipper 2TM domain-containing protein [Gammaproteobacteria bacterium]
MKGLHTLIGSALLGVLLALGGCASEHTVQPVEPVQPAYGYDNTAPVAANCVDCATVTNIEPIPEGSGGSPAGAIIGAIIGGAVGHQFGGGTGQTAATIGGAAVGAYAGSQYSDGEAYDYRISVRTDAGEIRTFVQDQPPAFGVGTRVRLNAD